MAPPIKSTTRLRPNCLQVLPLSKFAHLIWVPRRERVIQEKEQKSAPRDINTRLTDEKTIAGASAPISQPLEIVSDSKYVIEGLTEHLQKWEDQRWTSIKNTIFFQRC